MKDLLWENKYSEICFNLCAENRLRAANDTITRCIRRIWPRCDPTRRHCLQVVNHPRIRKLILLEISQDSRQESEAG